MIGLLATFGFLPLASPMVVAVLPLLAERMLASGYPLWWQAKFQYDAFVVMMLCCAAVDGAARLQRRWPERWDKLLTYTAHRPSWLRGASPGGRPPGAPRLSFRGDPSPRTPLGRDPSPRTPLGRPATLWAAAICAAALVYLPSSPFGSLLHPGFYGVNARMRAAAAAIAHVPAGVEVEASDNIGPRLSGRDTVLLLDGTPRWRRGWSGTPSGSTSRSARPASRPRRWPTCRRTGTRRCSPTTATWCCTARPTHAPRMPWPTRCPRPACTRTSATDDGITGAEPARGQSRPARPPAAAGPSPAARLRAGPGCAGGADHRAPGRAAGPGAVPALLRAAFPAGRVPPRRSGRTDHRPERGQDRADARHHPPGVRPGLPATAAAAPAGARARHARRVRPAADGGGHRDAGRGGPEPDRGRAYDVQPARPGAGGALARSSARGPGPGGARARAAGPGAASRRLGPGRAVAAHVGRTLARPAPPGCRSGSALPATHTRRAQIGRAH